MADTNTFNFTNRILSSLQLTAGKRSKEFTDAKINNLKLELTETGNRTFWFRAQRNGRRYAVRIGSYPAIGIDEARKAALEKLAQLERGEDPTEDRTRRANDPTLEEFFQTDYLPYAKAHKVSWQNDQNRFDARFPDDLRKQKLSQITRRDVIQFHADLKGEVTGKRRDALKGKLGDRFKEKLSPSTANRYLVLLSAIFRYAVECEVVENNPCAGVKQFRENNARTRFLDETEIASFLEALEYEENETAAMVLKGLLLTGLRKSELKDARWRDVNLERGELVLARTKNGDRRTVILSDDAVALIASLPSKDQSEWLFPGRDGDKPIANIDKPFQRAIRAAGIEDFTIHGLRHTFASHLAMNGSSLLVIGQTLGHRSMAVTQRYSHLSGSTLREAGNVIGRIVQSAVTASRSVDDTVEDEAHR